jgi:hypothetical protein
MSPNFTDCEASEYGSDFCLEVSDKRTSAMLMTAVRCQGPTVTYSSLNFSSIPELTDPNFVDCQAGVAVIYAETHGHSIERCYFWGNAADKEILVGSVSRQFTGYDCVFSGSLPSEDYCTFQNCESNSGVVTLAISHVDMWECLGAPVPAPATEVPNDTPEPTPATQSVPRSPAATLSPLQWLSTLSDRDIRVFVTKECFALTGSTFLGIKPPDGINKAIFEQKGGAIRVSNQAFSAKVTDTLFWQCCVIYASPYNRASLWEGMFSSVYTLRVFRREYR